MAVRRLGEGAELLNGMAQHQCALPRSRHVGDRERELAWPGRKPGHAPVEGPKPAQRVKEGIQRVGVVAELPLARLRVDQPQPGDRVRLGDRQLEIHEGVAVAELPPGLLASVQGDRALHPQVARRSVAAPHPSAQTAGDHREDDVVDRDAFARAVLDPLQSLEGEGRPGDLARRTDVAIEIGVCAGAKLAPERGRQADQDPRLACLARCGTPALARPARGSGRGARSRRLGGGRRGRRSSFRVPEQPGDQPDRAHPVRHRVVEAPDQRGSLTGQRQRVEAP
jgi:hypothetical protein